MMPSPPGTATHCLLTPYLTNLIPGKLILQGGFMGG